MSRSTLRRPDNAESSLLAALATLYASALQPELLKSFLAQMSQLTGSVLGAVMAHDLAHSQGSVSVVHGADGFDLASYEREYSAENLWFQRSGHAMRSGAIINSDDYVPRPEFRASRYYNDVLHQFDRAEQGVALCAEISAGTVVVMAFNRSGRLPAFSDAQLSLFRQLQPHWLNVYAIQRRLSWLEQRTSNLDEALDQLTVAMVLFDSKGRMSKTNEPAEMILRDGSYLQRRGGWLVSRFSQKEMADAVTLACTWGSSGKGTRIGRKRTRLILRDGKGNPMATADLHPLPLTGGASEGHAAVMFLQAIGSPAIVDSADVLRRTFGLTASECRLGLALQKYGHLEQAAEEAGITRASARTRLNLLFDKTGEHTQAGLLRLLDAVLT